MFIRVLAHPLKKETKIEQSMESVLDNESLMFINVTSFSNPLSYIVLEAL